MLTPAAACTLTHRLPYRLLVLASPLHLDCSSAVRPSCPPLAQVAEVNRIVGGGKVAKVQVVGPDGTVVEQDDPSAVREAQFKALRIPVLAALLFFIWAAFIAPKARRV